MKLSALAFTFMITAVLLTGDAHPEDKAQKKEDPSTVLAKVGDRVITVFDMDQALLTMSQEDREKNSTPEGRKNLLQNLIDLHLFEMEARRIGLAEDPAIKAQIDTIERNFLSRQLILYYIRNELKPPSEDDAMAYYQKHIQEYSEPQELLARHILVKTRKEAEEIIKLLKNGADFVQLANERSIAPDAEKGGLVGWFSMGRMLPTFEKAVFKLKKGEISDVVWTRYGYHVIKLEDRKEGKTKPFEQVKRDIYAKLVKSYQEEAIQTLREKLMKEIKVEVFN
jgi:peptidyl-prolyl cis-trans isomerase C